MFKTICFWAQNLEGQCPRGYGPGSGSVKR